MSEQDKQEQGQDQPGQQGSASPTHGEATDKEEGADKHGEGPSTSAEQTGEGTGAKAGEYS